MEDIEVFELLNKIYKEMNNGFIEISNEISNLKEAVTENPMLFENLSPKIDTLSKVQKNFEKQLSELKTKIIILWKSTY